MEPQQPRRRRRIARSCIECARRKIKCDRKQPCRRCVTNQLQCTYRGYNSNSTPLIHHPENTSGLNASIHSPSSVHAHQAEGIRSALDANALRDPLTPAARALTPTGTTHIDLGASQTQTERQSSICGQSSEPILAGILSRIETLERSSTDKPTFGLSETNQATFGRPPHIESSEWIFSKTRIMRWSLWMGKAKEVPPLLHSVHKEYC